MKEREPLQSWPKPLPAEKQIELAREMARLRRRIRYVRLWRQAACRTQDLLGWRRYDEILRARQRDYERVRNVLWETNMSLVCWVAQKCNHDILTLDELVEVGTLKLVQVLDSGTYDPSRAVLSTYLTTVLRRELWRAIQREAKRRSRQQLIDDERDWDNLVGYHAGDETPEPVDLQKVRDALSLVGDRERDVVLARASEERPTLAAVGRRMKRSKERVRQLERKGLEQLAEHLGAEGVCCGLGRV